MKLEDLKKFNLPYYKYDETEVIVKPAVATAWIATTADAWVYGYAKIGEDKYHFSFQGGISQQEDPRFPGSKDRPKDFPVSVIGIFDGKIPKLAYATSRDHITKKINTLRVTDIEKIIDIWDYRLND